MKRLALLVAALAAITMAGSSRAAGPLPMHVPVLMYHRIQCGTNGRFVCPAVLDAQMAALQAQGWHTITADALATDYLTGVCPGPMSVVITVDDGALDGYTAGAPIWEAHGQVATFAMVTGKAGDYLQPGWPTNPYDSVAKPHFSWDQARDLVARGFGIANHTVLHTAVRNDSQALLDAEVQAAQDQISTEVGFAPLVFVYPYGSFGTAETPYLASRFTLALTDPGSNGAHNGASEQPGDPMHAPRIRVSSGTTPARLLYLLKPYRQPC